MALVSCSACGHQVSTQATKCPNCGHRLRKPRRGFFGKLFKWGFIAFNILMAFWLVTGLGSVSDHYNSAASDAARAGTAIGGTIGAGLILVLWVIGDVILGLFVLFTRPRD